jgi:hypothetical protein
MEVGMVKKNSICPRHIMYNNELCISTGLVTWKLANFLEELFWIHGEGTES